MRVSSTIQAAHIDNNVSREITMKASSDAADQAAMLSAMTNLYSDKPEAVRRELSTNAADSHIAAGQTRPIEVTLPTRDFPFFVVQDYGTGMSAHDVEFIYSLFGRSTKRDSDAETGMLGFGCKAPLTYCLSFNGEAVKDGFRTSFVVTKNEKGVGTIKIMSESATDKPDGMKITVPVPPNEANQFAIDSMRFYSFWRGGVVVRVGQNDEYTEPERLESSTWLDPDIAILPRGGRSYVVMGNVAYPYDTPDALPTTCTWLQMNYGTEDEPLIPIDFVPSREALMHTEQTDETLATIRKFIKSALDRTVTERIEACTNEYERIRTIVEIRSQMPYRYQHPLLGYNHLNLDRKGDSRRFMWLVHGDRQSETYVNEQWITNDRYSFVTDFPYKRVANLHRDMIDAVGISEPYIVIPEQPGFSTFGFPGRSWKNIPALPKKERKRVEERPLFREETRYGIYVEGNQVHIPRYEGDLPILYDDGHGVAQRLSNKYDVAVGSIASTQVDRFCRLHPGAQSWYEYVTAIARRANGYLTKEDRRYLHALPWERTLSAHLGEVAKQVKDKTARQSMNLTTSEHLDTLIDIGNVFGTNILRDVMKPNDYKAYTNLGGSYYNGDRNPGGDTYIAVNYPMLSSNYSGFFDRMTHVDAEEWLFYLNGRWPTVKANLKALADSDTDDNDNDQAAA